MTTFTESIQKPLDALTTTEKSNSQLNRFTRPLTQICQPPLLTLSLLPLNPQGQAWDPFSFNINIIFKYNFIYIFIIFIL